MLAASPAGTAIVLMATVRSILGSRARNTAPMAPRPSSARISYRPSCGIAIAPRAPSPYRERKCGDHNTKTLNDFASRAEGLVCTSVLDTGGRCLRRIVRGIAMGEGQPQHVVHSGEYGQRDGEVDTPAPAHSDRIVRANLVQQDKKHCQDLGQGVGLA